MTLATKKNMTRYKLHDVLLTGNPDCTLDQWNKLISTYLLLTDKETKEEARAREQLWLMQYAKMLKETN